MQMSGEQRIAAPRQRVWEALNDPDVLRASIPGCQTLEKEGEDRLIATVEVKIGPIGARFKGAVEIADRDPAHGYTLAGEGNAGIAGTARGSARVRLADEPGGGTLVSYDVDSQVGGRLAQLGGPIIDATARQLAAKFFSRFGEVVGAPAAAEVAATPLSQPVAQPVASPAATIPATTPPLSFPWAWVVVTAVAILTGFLLGRSYAADWWVVVVMVLTILAAAAGYETGRRGNAQS